MAIMKRAEIGPKVIRVALYTRVSTDIQANKEEGSLETQEARLKAAIQARYGDYEIRYVFREEGASGKSLDRPALQRMLARVRSGDIDLIMVTRIDRLSRSLLDFYEVHRLFEDHGVQFVSLHETFDTSNAVGRAMLKLVLVFAELEREQTAERTRTAIQARAERGLWNGGPPPLGYDPAGSGYLKVNENEASLVRQIFAKYLEVQSSHKVAKWLNSCGHRQKTYTSRRRGDMGGGQFLVQNVTHILTNRLYLGEIEHKGRQHKGQHEALIDPETFERTQAVVESHRSRPSGGLEHTIYEYQLTGLLRCECGYALTTSCSNGRGGRYHYYRCVGLTKRSKHPCQVKQVKAPVVDEAVLDIVRDAARSPEFLAAAVAEANRVARAALTPVQARVQGLKKELAEAERTGSELLKQILLSGVGASAMAQKLLQESEERQAQLKMALGEAEVELADRTTEQLDLETILRALRSFDAAYDALSILERREFLQVMVKEVVVHADYMVVELYEGRQATRLMAGLGKGSKRGGGEQKNNGREGRSAGGPKPDSAPTLASVADLHAFSGQECVTEFNWLPWTCRPPKRNPFYPGQFRSRFLPRQGAGGSVTK